MYYHSEMPKIVGEFNATRLHELIDGVAPENASLDGYTIVDRIQQALDINIYADIETIAGISWGRFFSPGAFKGYTNDSDVNFLDAIQQHEGTSTVDKWHADDNASARVLSLPQTLTTASRWPTHFIIGDVAVRYPQLLHSLRFWSTNEGEEAISRAVDKGDAREFLFETGQVVVAPPGVIHRRDIPTGASGYRYFMRLFPRFGVIRSEAFIGRVRPFKSRI